MIDAYNTIEARLTELHDNYPQKKAAMGRRDADWNLCNARIFTEVELLQAYAEATGLPRLEDEALTEIKPMPDISVDYLKRWCCLPFRHGGGQLTLMICDPYNLNEHECIFYQICGLEVNFSLARRSTIEKLIDEVYKGNKISALDENPLENLEALKALAEEAKIVRLVNEMFNQAVERRASDIHVEPEENILIIRFRIDGDLSEYQSFPKSDYPAIASRIKLISGLNIAESRVPQDGRTHYVIGRTDMDLRVSTLPTMNGESIVLRLLKKDAISFDLNNVGMLPEMQEKFNDLIKIPYGIILMVGPIISTMAATHGD